MKVEKVEINQVEKVRKSQAIQDLWFQNNNIWKRCQWVINEDMERIRKRRKSKLL